MKRERERKWYYVYGNLSERFYDEYYHKMNTLGWLMNHPEESYVFQTCYPLENDKYALKEKHYIHILHRVILDYFEEIPDELFDLDINTMANTEGKIYLYFKLKAKQKDEEIIYANVESSATRCNERNETEVTSETAL